MSWVQTAYNLLEGFNTTWVLDIGCLGFKPFTIFWIYLPAKGVLPHLTTNTTWVLDIRFLGFKLLIIFWRGSNTTWVLDIGCLGFKPFTIFSICLPPEVGPPQSNHQHNSGFRHWMSWVQTVNMCVHFMPALTL